MPSTPRILMFVSCHGCGATVLLSQMALALRSELGDNLQCISGPCEQVDGILSRSREKGLAISVVAGIDDHRQFRRHVEALRQLAAAFRPDVVQVHSNWQLAIAAAARRKLPQSYKIGYWIHGFRHNSPIKALFATALIGGALRCWADLVVASSSVVERRFRFLGSRVHRLMLGVDEEFFGVYASPPDAGPTRFVFAGQFREGKNQDMLIRALAKVGGNAERELVLPGEGPLRDACVALAGQLGLHARVVFPGQMGREALRNLILNCHAALVPTNYETFGSCIAEPLVLGRPVISRRVGCATDVIVAGENGFLFDSEDELPRLFQELVDHPESCDRMGRVAYAGRDVFAWSRIAAEYVERIKSL